MGLVKGERKQRFNAWLGDVNQLRDQLKSLRITPSAAQKNGLKINLDGQRRSAYELLSYTENTIASLSSVWPELDSLNKKVSEPIEIEASYAVYLDRQSRDIAVQLKEESRLIPEGFDYLPLPGLSNELKQKLTHQRPRTIAHASQIEGMTPAAVTLILAQLRRSESADAELILKSQSA